MSAAEVVQALRGRGGLCRCPAHRDRHPSLSVTDAPDGRLLTHCFSGCSPEAVWNALKRKGLVGSDDRAPRRTPAPRRPQTDNSAHALDIWRASTPAAATSVEQYLRARGITIPVPPTIRYHPNLKHAPTGLTFEALVAGVCGPDRRVVAIHRVFLLPGGHGKARVSEPKMSLGPVAGGAVRLAPVGPVLQLAESIEDGLALLQMTGQATWAVPSASAMKSFIPPEGVEELILAPDHDRAGLKAIEQAVPRLREKGLRVRQMLPPVGADWCDVVGTYEERAGIREFDGGDDRHDAERLAFEEHFNGR
jgi:hypothetical protein